MSERKDNSTNNLVVVSATDLSLIPLVEIEGTTVISNTIAIHNYIEKLTPYINDIIKNDVDVDVVSEKIKTTKADFSHFKAYRVGVTDKLVKVRTDFISYEKQWLEEIKKLEAHKEVMQETTFKIAEQHIREEFEALKSANFTISIDLKVFESFITVQRKLKGMLPNKKSGLLSKGALDKIDEEFNNYIKPIIEAKELKEREDREDKQFQSSLPDFDSSNMESLSDARISLYQIKESIDELYPTIATSCHRTVDNKLDLIESSINGLFAHQRELEARKQLEAERQKRQEEDRLRAKEVEVVESPMIVQTPIVENVENETTLPIKKILKTMIPMIGTREELNRNIPILKEFMDSKEMRYE